MIFYKPGQKWLIEGSETEVANIAEAPWCMQAGYAEIKMEDEDEVRPAHDYIFAEGKLIQDSDSMDIAVIIGKDTTASYYIHNDILYSPVQKPSAINGEFLMGWHKVEDTLDNRNMKAMILTANAAKLRIEFLESNNKRRALR